MKNIRVKVQSPQKNMLEPVLTFAYNYLDLARLGYQLAESGVVAWHTSSPERFEQLQRIREIFTQATAIWAIVDYIQLLVCLEQKWGVLSFFIFENGQGIVHIPVLVIAAAIFYVAQQIAEMAATYFLPQTDLSIPQLENRNDIQVRWGSLDCCATHYLTSTRIILNIALAFFATNPYLYLAFAGLQLYSLSKSLSVRWLRYTQTFENPMTERRIAIEGNEPIEFLIDFQTGHDIVVTHNNSQVRIPIFTNENGVCMALISPDRIMIAVPIAIHNNHLIIPGGYQDHQFSVNGRAVHERLRKIIISYLRPMFHASSHHNAQCAICLEENPHTLICKNHAQHDTCIVGSIYGEFDRFNDVQMHMWDKYLNTTALPTRYVSEDGRPLRVHYSFSFSKEALPRCSLCRNQPDDGEITISTVDAEFLYAQEPATVVLV